jgi:hypothetical protein
MGVTWFRCGECDYRFDGQTVQTAKKLCENINGETMTDYARRNLNSISVVKSTSRYMEAV